jgi:hypothetical protein
MLGRTRLERRRTEQPGRRTEQPGRSQHDRRGVESTGLHPRERLHARARRTWSLVPPRSCPWGVLNDARGDAPQRAGSVTRVRRLHSIRGETAEVDRASARVHVEFYITAWDDVTAPTAEALDRAVGGGVQVRLLSITSRSRGIPDSSRGIPDSRSSRRGRTRPARAESWRRAKSTPKSIRFVSSGVTSKCSARRKVASWPRRHARACQCPGRGSGQLLR